MKLLIGNEKRSLPLCAYVAGYGKSSHILRLSGKPDNTKVQNLLITAKTTLATFAVE